ncbi:peptidase, M48 family [Selenomonas sp. FOBRC6]|uniref:zinc metalloprotease HtpX n=1 Tax=Selenomonas sp. FOBRC6 TaxID=936572 RepID=UPI0002782867|nr:zinc metalloprotease HtpX [Selenomonas sp. FOBRC6]EJO23141.1 peptidase, M48 family [Selenomonas sp. FOBRC6]
MNTLKTTMLMALLMALMVALGGIFAGHTGMTVMLIIALGMNFFSYWFSDRMVLSMYNAQEVDRSSAPELYGLVEKLAGRAELPMPRVYIINEDAPNAFATGRNPSNAAVAVTTGLIRALDYDEISGVLGHELAHVKHRDILISTIAATMATVISYAASIAQWAAIFGGGRSSDDDRGGFIGLIATAIIAPIAAALIQMAISRSREYSADEGGAEICGNPNYLASALEKIEYYAVHGAPLPEATPATAHMCIINPLTGRDISFKSLFSTHPDTQERIARLREQAQRMHIR